MNQDTELEILARIDPVCEDFERRWRSGDQPRLDQFLAGFAGPERLILLKHLLEIDSDYRRSKGLRSDLEYYCESHPELAKEIQLAKAAVDSSTIRQPTVDTSAEPPGKDFHLSFSESDSAATHVGNYELLEALGEGGMGTVFLAQQNQPVVRKVALKVIKGGYRSKQILTRFEAERQAMAMMDHPNIARILDAGETPSGHPFFAMELVTGLPLTKYCAQKKLTIDQRLQLFRDICSGVQHAHQKGIIHRDLKPSNIMVAEVDGKAVPKVIDFGLAKALESTQKLTDGSLYTGEGQVLGTLKYMSPEQAGVRADDIDTRTDIYALGIILYELLTGSTPLDDSSLRSEPLHKILEWIREQEAPKPSDKLRHIKDNSLSKITHDRNTDAKRLHSILAGDLDWIVMKSLEKDRARRYESVSGLSDDIRRYLESEPVSARPPSYSYRVQKFVRKHRGFVTAAALVFIALLLGIIGTTTGMLRADSALALANDREKEANDARDEEQQQREKAEQARTDAEREAEISAEINRFFNEDVLAMSYVQRSVSDISVREALINAASRIDGRFEAMPVVEGEIRRTIGRSLAGLGRFKEGIEQLKKSHEVLEQALGPDDPKTLATVGELGRAYRDWEQNKEAIPYLETYLAGMIRLHGEDSRQTNQAQHMYAMTLHGLGQNDLAEEYFLKTLAWRRKNQGNNSGGTIQTVLSLGALYLYDHRYEEAEPLVVEAAESAQKYLGENNYTTFVAIDNLAQLYLDSGRYSDAEPLLVKTLEQATALFGENHPSFSAIAGKLADLKKKTERYSEAIELRHKQIQSNSIVYGPKSEMTFNSRFELVSCLRNDKQFDAAETELLSIRDDIQGSLKPKHPFKVIVEFELGQLDFSKADYEAAQEHFRKAHDDALDWYGDKHWLIESTTGLMANAAWMLKDYETARTNWRSMLQASENRGEPITNTLPMRRQVAMADLKLGDHESAKELILDSRSKFDAIPSEAKALLNVKYRMLLELADCHLKSAEYTEAEEVAREVLEFTEWEEGKEYRRFRAQFLLGMALTHLDKPKEAEAELKGSYESLVKAKPSTTDEQRAIEGLVELYQLTGREQEALEWQTKLDELLAKQNSKE